MALSTTLILLLSCSKGDSERPPIKKLPIKAASPQIQVQSPRVGSDHCPNFAGIFRDVQRGVVSVHVPDLENPQSKEPLRIGSGFFVDKHGSILTNAHVVEGVNKTRVRLWNNQEYDAVVLGRDFFTDLAILRLKSPIRIPALTLATRDEVQVGDWVMAIGTPYGLSHTLTVGVISAQHRRRVFMDSSDQYTNFLQTDAPIHPGNSGGPLLNTRGQVIGVSTALQQGAPGIGFALPISVAHALIPLLRRGGVIHRPWLGMVLPHETNRVYSSGIPVIDVLENSGAWEAGLRPGDVLVAFNDRSLTRIPDLRFLLTALSLGGAVNLDFRRNHKLMRARILLIGPDSPSPTKGFDRDTEKKAAELSPSSD